MDEHEVNKKIADMQVDAELTQAEPVPGWLKTIDDKQAKAKAEAIKEGEDRARVRELQQLRKNKNEDVPDWLTEGVGEIDENLVDRTKLKELAKKVAQSIPEEHKKGLIEHDFSKKKKKAAV